MPKLPWILPEVHVDRKRGEKRRKSPSCIIFILISWAQEYSAEMWSKCIMCNISTFNSLPVLLIQEITHTYALKCFIAHSMTSSVWFLWDRLPIKLSIYIKLMNLKNNIFARCVSKDGKRYDKDIWKNYFFYA